MTNLSFFVIFFAMFFPMAQNRQGSGIALIPHPLF
jgi:hypothetical protein